MTQACHFGIDAQLQYSAPEKFIMVKVLTHIKVVRMALTLNQVMPALMRLYSISLMLMLVIIIGFMIHDELYNSSIYCSLTIKYHSSQ